MASTQKKQAIAGVWAAVGAASGAIAYRRLRSFEERAPGVAAALRELQSSDAVRLDSVGLGAGPLKVSWWPRQGHVDEGAGLARASFLATSSDGKFAHVLVMARRQSKFQDVWESKEDDEEAELVGWRYYWAKPWMLKTHFLETVSNVRKGIQSVPKEATEDLAGWDLETLVLLPAGDASRPQVLLGDPLNLPEYEAMCLRRDHDTKDEKSRSRLRIVLGIASVLGLFAGCRRLIKSMSVSQSYGFVRRAVLADTDVQFVLGPTANIQSSNGTFTARYINARLRLVSDSGTVADVDVAATRDDGGIRPWRVALARMRVGGSIYKLGLQNEYR